MTDGELLARYVAMAEFMALSFSDDVEVLVHDLRNLDASVIAIFNGHVSGRTVGAPMTGRGREFMAGTLHQQDQWVVNYRGLTDTGVEVRSSTCFIRNETGKLIGFLCVNVDLRKYHGLRHLFEAMTRMAGPAHHHGAGDEPEVLTMGPASGLDRIIGDYCALSGRTLDAMRMEDRLEIMRLLHKQDFFNRKGAVGEVAGRLKISVPSVYRYLKTIRRETA